MGKKPGPSSEELEFIFGCFLNGFADRNILNEMEDNGFNKRNPRFMREQRKHWEAAKKVLQANYSDNNPDQIRKRQHCGRMMGIAQTLLSNGLENVTYTSGKYYLNVLNTGEVSKHDLVAIIDKNLGSVYTNFSKPQFRDYFLPHLMAENSSITSSNFDSYRSNNSYELIRILRTMLGRGNLKGGCPICQE